MQLIAFIDREKFVEIIPDTGIKLVETIQSEIENELTGEREPPKYHVSAEDNTILYVDEYGIATAGFFDQFRAENASILIICDETKIDYCPKDEFIVLRHSHRPQIHPDLITSNKYIQTFEGREDRSQLPGLKKNRYPELIDYLIGPNTKNYTEFIKDTFAELNPKIEKCLNNLHNISVTRNFGELNSLEGILEGLNDFKIAYEIRDGLQNQNKQAITINDDCCVIWDAKSNPELFGVSAKNIIKTEPEFQKSNFSSYKQIYILAELVWENHVRSEFSGYTIAKELRKNKVRCPIVFCSFVERLNLEHFPDARIRKTSGHYFVHLPDIIQPENYNFKLDEDTLEDINIHMSDLQALRDIFHDANDTIAAVISSMHENTKADKIIAAKEFMSNALIKFSKSVPNEKLDDFNKKQEKILTDIESTINQESFKENHLRGILDKYKAELYALLPKEEFDNEQSKPKRKNWEVLFIDDVDFNCETLISNFDRNGINCRKANNADEAYKILTEDEQGGKRIAVVIADFRLYKNGDDQDDWQEEQGYTILKKIPMSGRFKSHYAYVMLTSKEGSIKQNIKKRSGFSVLWFHKNDVLGGLPHSFDIFCHRIIEVGEEAFFKKRTVPQLGGQGQRI